ncbi:MAG: hypothetical protein CVT49_01275 [candidate division Zixibacteria bacterium HGW-Zixibacteria-1]|nr:MAG: hypothetical protein CVT49_01275 [candidate division Zixibacteria bacterium HGW-Zixibacteria-1]
MKKTGLYTVLLAVMALSSSVFGDGTKVLEPLSIEQKAIDPNDPRVVLNGFHSKPSPRNILNLEREHPWSLPKMNAAAAAVDTIRLLGLRFDFLNESPDNPLTTGRGKFDLRDTLAFQQEFGHMIDPSPHDKKYFDKHFEALRNYYFFVSDGRIELVWDIYPQADSEAYHLNNTMGYYGSQNPYLGLTEYFIDCFRLVDTIDANVRFADYDSYFLFHAGSDRQNDIGFPSTPSDFYTGYIFLIDSALYLDNNGIDSTAVVDALIMPETASQDNRATALNAVIAHEFGHQLGLIDLYRTDNFFTMIGDFGLMDNNGFGTGVDFGFEVGRAFGTSPIYPMAWSRAFLGFDDPVVFRQGTSIEVAAAEMASAGTRIGKLPISEFEYFLIENRQEDIDGKTTVILADSTTSVILGPSDIQRNLTGEYDFLLPGSGMLIWKVDEIVAYLDYNRNGYNNFFDNQLQLDPDRPFVKLMEADGLVNFGGIYYSGYGTAKDMYYAGNNTSFTPNTNPPAEGYGRTNSHIYVSNISESGTTMTFDLERDFVSDGFPQRAGSPVYSLSPIAADLDKDGTTELIAASGRNVIVVNEDSTDITPSYGPPFLDTSYVLNIANYYLYSDPISASPPVQDFGGNNPVYPVPIFARTPENITAGPAVGNFGLDTDSLFVAVAAGRWLYVYSTNDANLDGMAERKFDSLSYGNRPIVWISFGDSLTFAAVDTALSNVRLINIPESGGLTMPASPIIDEPEFYGASNIDYKYALLAGDSLVVRMYYIYSDTDFISYDLEGQYTLGPVAADLNRDDLPEVIMATPEGDVKIVTIDAANNSLSLYNSISLGDSIFVNPIVSDLDEDGYPDIIFGGRNKILALDRNLVNLMNFPLVIDRSFPNSYVISSPVVGDINRDGVKDIVVSTSGGRCYAFSSKYSFDEALLFGFPLAAGGLEIGSPVLFKKTNGGGLGFLGIDGWFYSYDVSFDSAKADWPMAGGGPTHQYYLPDSRLKPVATYADKLPDDKFFCYPNPTYDGRTTIRFFVGDDADVTMNIYDMSGKKVSDEYNLTGRAGSYEEMMWDGSSLPSGVYRCVIEADFAGETLTSFTDIAIIK